MSGSSQLTAGTNELSGGLVALQAGAEQSADGAAALKTGTAQLSAGATALADGLADGAHQAPDLGGDEQRSSLAALLSTPVSSTSTNVAIAQFGGPGGAPALLILASTLIPLVTLMSFRSHRFVTAGGLPSSSRSAIRRFAVVSAVSLAAIACVGPLLWSTFTPAPMPYSVTQVICVAAAATLMNVALVSLLFTTIGYVAGALGSLTAMMLQLFSYGGVWMVETVPGWLQWMHPLAPMTYVQEGFRSSFNGAPGFTQSVAAVLAIGTVAAVANWLVYRIFRRYQTRLLEVPVAEQDRRTAAL